jgi:hypothetical protein
MVLTAEYFVPASAACGHLTAEGVCSFTAENPGESCIAAFDRLRHTLTHKIEDDDDSGYSPSRNRSTVSSSLSHLHVTVRGSSASVLAPYRLGSSKLVEVGGRWKFSAYPPTVGF